MVRPTASIGRIDVLSPTLFFCLTPDEAPCMSTYVRQTDQLRTSKRWMNYSRQGWDYLFIAFSGVKNLI